MTLSHVESTLEDFSYPISREAAARELSGVTVRHADGEGDLGEAVSNTASDSFDSADDLTTERYAFLPAGGRRRPGQSEGEG